MKTFVNSLIMGTCGALAVFVSFTLQWPTWVLFIAWLSYYLFGKSLKSAAAVLAPISAGLVLGIAIQTLGGLFSSYMGAIGFPIAVLLLITSLTYLAKIKGFTNIPAWFVGLIVFFGVHPPIAVVPLLSLFFPIVIGLGFAFINDTLSNTVTKKL